jgi:hypothetical protein
MEYIIFKNGFYLVGKFQDIIRFLREKARFYRTVKDMIRSELN